jgi:Fur family ferric uptake transcriptional regulator
LDALPAMERMTRQKQAVLHAIEHSGRSLHPSEIQALAQKSVPTLNLSTVYRQLKTLVDEQRVNKVELPGQPARFEAAPHDTPAQGQGHSHGSEHEQHGHGQVHDHHHHFHCLNCEQVFPIHSCPGHMDSLAPAGFRVEGHDLTLHGRCADCNAPPKPQPGARKGRR